MQGFDPQPFGLFAGWGFLVQPGKTQLRHSAPAPPPGSGAPGLGPREAARQMTQEEPQGGPDEMWPVELSRR